MPEKRDSSLCLLVAGRLGMAISDFRPLNRHGCRSVEILRANGALRLTIPRRQYLPGGEARNSERDDGKSEARTLSKPCQGVARPSDGAVRRRDRSPIAEKQVR